MFINIIGQYDSEYETNIVFRWALPQQVGPAAVIDNYTFVIMPKPLSHPTTNVISSTSLNVTLNYNTEYMVTVVATNCAGESALVILEDIKYSKSFIHSEPHVEFMSFTPSF